MFRIICLFLMAGMLTSHQAGAVQLSQNGMGEALIYPYYTVNNDLNTLYSVINTTDQAKAISVRFQEGQFGYDVLNFSVYLDAYDVWTGALVAIDSTVVGHVDEPSAIHLTADTSCAPFLIGAGQQFLPFQIELDGAFNDNMQRAREGQLIVIEMGVLTGEAAAAVNHEEAGLPNDCGMIENEWADDGAWSLGDLGDPTGGILGSATIVNVAEGLAFPYDAVALQNFWQGAGQHAEPGSELPNLASAFPQSKVLLDNGELALSVWNNGYEAVSAVLMNSKIFNEYALDTLVAGKTEWIVTMPTKKHHTTINTPAMPPFQSFWTGQSSCDIYEIKILDREEQFDQPISCNFTCPPTPPGPKMCYASNVFEFALPGTFDSAASRVLGSPNHYTLDTPNSAVTESGWAMLSFSEPEHLMIPVSGVSYFGLPATGFAVQQFTNAGAGEGLLAQYGNVFMHKGIVETFSGQ